MTKPINGADPRPRLHIWKEPEGYSWSRGPVGTRFGLQQIGGAVEDALASINHQPAVIIWEAAQAHKNG